MLERVAKTPTDRHFHAPQTPWIGEASRGSSILIELDNEVRSSDVDETTDDSNQHCAPWLDGGARSSDELGLESS